MKLIRFGEEGCEEPGVILADGRRIDASRQFSDYDEGFFAMGGIDSLKEWVSDNCPGGAEVDPMTRLGPCVARPSKLVCMGKNYFEHAKELGEGIPQEPTIFMKATSAWSGPTDDVKIPRGSTKLDYEVELALSSVAPLPMWTSVSRSTASQVTHLFVTSQNEPSKKK
jgi:2,4-didehydro-3-deoxy-L-rhamnonate hydrolase